MDYYYYDQLDENNIEGNDYDYDSMIASDDESLIDVYQRCIKSSTQQVQQYIIVLLGCGFLQRVSWELVRRTLGNSKYQCLYHISSLICGLISLWFYVGPRSSIYVCMHVLNLCLFLKLITLRKAKYTGLLLTLYTLISQVIMEYNLESEEYEVIRGPQMIVGMKLISVAFSLQDGKEVYQFITLLGYLLSPASLILGPWISLKDYRPVFNVRLKLMPYMCKIIVNICLAIVFLNLSNCILPWLKQLLGTNAWWEIYLDAFSVRCSHYFVCFLSQATMMSAITSSVPYSSSPLAATHFIVNPWAIEFPYSLSSIIRNWNIPMHLWLKQNIFDRLRLTKYPYYVAIFLTYLVSCFVHGLHFRVHLVLISLCCFSYFENLLRHCLAQIFDACIESKACTQNCNYSHCPRRQGQSYVNIVLVRLANFLFSLIVVIQLAYLGVMLNTSTTISTSKNILQVWSNMNYIGHIVAIVMLVFYHCI